VLGVGPQMAQLAEEFARVRANEFTLAFTYPTRAELETISILHRDMSPQAQARRGKREESVQQLVRDFETGELYPEDLSPELLQRLRQILDEQDDGP
jgi:superfamily I DNA and RNA helicase